MSQDDWSGRIGDVLAAPLGDLIAGVGRGMADAQAALNQATIDAIKQLYTGDSAQTEMALLGYTPQWYAIPEVEADMQIALSLTGSHASSGRSGGISLIGVPVDAQFQNQFQYDLRAASRLKFKIVPVPPTSAAAGARVVPDLVGVTYADAVARLGAVGLPHVVTGWQPPAEGEDGSQSPPSDAQVTATTPAAGQLILEGEALEVRLPG